MDKNLNISELPEKIKVDSSLLKKRPGAPTTLELRRKSAPVQGKVKGKRDHYSEKEKINACCVFAVAGNSRRTAEITKIPESTIRVWKTTIWWNEITARIYAEQDEDLSSKLTKLVDNAVTALNDRLTDGDYFYNTKLNTIIRKPVNARDIAAVTVMAVDKRQLLRGKATSRTETISVSERMKDLAKQFKQFAEAKEVVQIGEEIEIG